MAFLFPFAPNWNTPFRVSLSYKTEIRTSRAFREQRFALRTQPRKELSFTVNPRRGKLTLFLGDMAARQQLEYVVPELPTVIRSGLSGTTLAGATLLPLEVDPGPLWLVAGAYIVIEGVAGQELAQIVSVDVSGIVLSAPLAADVPAGSPIYPGIIGRFDQALRGQLVTNMVGQFPLTFSADPGRNPYPLVEEPPSVFNGREVFVLKPNWRTAPQVTLDGYLETLDYDRGRVAHVEPVGFNTFGMRLEFWQRTNDEAESLIQFFYRMKGQQGEFYMPTWGNDFDLSEGALSGATVLEVPSPNMADNFQSSTVYKAAIAFYADGSYQCNRVVSLAPVDGFSRFTFATAWSQALNETNVILMCWLPVWRLAVDTITLDFLTNRVFQGQITARTLEDLA